MCIYECMYIYVTIVLKCVETCSFKLCDKHMYIVSDSKLYSSSFDAGRKRHNLCASACKGFRVCVGAGAMHVY